MVDGSGGVPDQIPANDPHVETSNWWRFARETGRLLRAGQPPPVVNVYGPILRPGEEGRLSTSMFYSRLYGGRSTYRRNGYFAFGSIPFMIGAYGVNELINQNRKAAAQQEAAVQWRDAQMASVVVTSQRLLCGTVGGWPSFWFSTVTEFFPDLDNWTLTLGFDGQTPPLRLSGPPAPAIALWTAHAVLGAQWVDDPRLDRLR